MPTPDFFISSVTIRNFRGIKDLDLSIEPTAPCILIGPNNSGKSTVLDAIGMCLGAAKFSKYVISDEDFWRPEKGDEADEFVISVQFASASEGALPAVKGGVGDPIEVNGVRVIGKKGDSSITRHLIDSHGDEILLNKGTPISKANQGAYKGFGLTGRSYARLADIQKWLPEVWQLDAKSIYPSLYEWKSGPLQKVLRLYKDDLLASKWTTPSGKAMPDALSQIQHFLGTQALPTPYWRDTLSAKMREKFQSYLGEQSGFQMAPTLSPVESWILSQLRIDVTPAAGLASVDSRRLGDGWQSLLRMAALELAQELAGKERILLLMEEPETYLHPHLRRRFRKIFSRLQNSGHQCIVTTHSPELISFAESQQIVRLRMTAGGTVKNTYPTSTATALKNEEKLHERGNHEMVFANLAVLTEGKGDEFAVRMGLEKTRIDCDALSISVVDCGSVSNLPSYAEVCSNLGIPWVAIHDKDLQPGQLQKQNTKAAREKLDALKQRSDRIVEWDNDLEMVLNCTGGAKATPEWIDAEYRQKTWSELAAEPKLGKYCKAIQSLGDHIKATLVAA
jgi:ABC-type multidrug transport system ATPase subunit